MYLGWFDDNPKKTATTKAREAIDAYCRRLKTVPNIVLVNEVDQGIELGSIAVRAEKYIRINNFWVGIE